MPFHEMSDAELAEALAQARDPQTDPLARQWNARVRQALLGRGEEPTRVGRFVVVRKVGKGAMGTVFLAYDPDLDRKVALKVLRTRGEAAREALLREGRALARLSHANVITVYEVGAVGDELFVAMEYVEGSSLREWLADPEQRAEQRWAQVLEYFASAGEGLHAAHEAGLVHRDFKPANVLVGEDGTVQVVDFGLARLDAGADPAWLDSDSGEGVQTRPSATAERGERPFRSESATGQGGGTIAYMAPERLTGKRGDPRSDQFSFCVSLYEALYGVRPFAAETVDELEQAMRSGKRNPPIRTPPVPPRCRKAILRGLSADPEARFASMADLVDDLRLDRGPRRFGWIAGVGIVAVVALAAWIGTRGGEAPEDRCELAAQPIEAVWSPEQRAAIGDRFATSGLDYAEASWASSEATLGRYAQDWATMRSEACAATWKHGEQSEAALDLRMACLDRRLAEFSGLVELFAAADADLVKRSLTAAERLTPLDACADVESLAAVVPPPEDVATRKKVEDIRRRLARGWAEVEADHAQVALDIATPAVEEAERLDYRPVLAEARLLAARALKELGDASAAESMAKQAMYAAEAGRHDEATARSATLLAQITRRHAARPETSEDWAELGRAAYTRLGIKDGLTSELSIAIANNHVVSGRYQEAELEYGRALKLAEAEGMTTRKLAVSINLGVALRRQGKHEDARRVLEQALDLGAGLGEHHPKLASTHNNLANVLDEMGEPEAALEHYRIAIAAYESNFGPSHVELGQLHNNVGTVLQAQGKFGEALAAFDRALAIGGEAHEGEHRDLATWLVNKGGCLADMGQHQDALAAHQEGLAMFERVLPENHPYLALAWQGVAADQVALARDAQARESYAKALEFAEASSLDQQSIADIQLAYAKALWPEAKKLPAKTQRARAIALARAAHIVYVDDEEMAREIEAWLADRSRTMPAKEDGD